ncbi:MCP methyltransferase, CheR-type with PAS/PAC sensor [Calothrix sp. NIES-4071]|nr:MCP methyltransferase, CheR-type with PAS/PAC sensor [Calothrix sp. NIES-4071]BAZ62892.1 MCP methyltransferase, CheR-type with PAS/PAC sensor [Calothrix sp. NIES-4105]
MIQSESEQEFEALLNYLKSHLGCDLTIYKRAGLVRRFEHHMYQLKINNYIDYLEYLKNHPREHLHLLNTILIKFSGFFRDRDSWNYLASVIIPQIIRNKEPGEQIRVWSAGCASGQEVYTIAILLTEILGIEQYLERVQMFATDVDTDALLEARRGSYSTLEIAGIDDKLLSKYFDKNFQNNEQRFVIDSKLRRKIIFGRHNLTLDAPMSKIDLVICRNVLIYLNSETTPAVLVRFHFALKDNGFLFLGHAESLIKSENIFRPIDIKHRIFAKNGNLTLEQYLLILPTNLRKKKAIMNTQTNET